MSHNCHGFITKLSCSVSSIESDLTVMRQGVDKFLIITGSAQTVRDLIGARPARADRHTRCPNRYRTLTT